MKYTCIICSATDLSVIGFIFLFNKSFLSKVHTDTISPVSSDLPFQIFHKPQCPAICI